MCPKIQDRIKRSVSERAKESLRRRLSREGKPGSGIIEEARNLGYEVWEDVPPSVRRRVEGVRRLIPKVNPERSRKGKETIKKATVRVLEGGRRYVYGPRKKAKRKGRDKK